MNLLKNLFKKKEAQIKTYADFWDWFEQNEKDFFKAVKTQDNIEKGFFDKLSPKLNELKNGFFFLTGMFDTNTAELILTVDGKIKNIFFAEELVCAAPNIEGWKFTALKPPTDIKNVRIKMAGFTFDADNMGFYSNDHRDFPDEIDISVVHYDLTEENKSAVANGVYIFLDNFLGELNFATTVDNLKIIGRGAAEKEVVPIGKLKDFLVWREKEFIEKYEGTRKDTANDNYSILEAKINGGNPLVAVINKDLLSWDSKASHPWIATIEIKYDGSRNNGMPDNNAFQLLSKIEQDVLEELKDFEGYLNIGRQTAEGMREVYFACKDFRRPSAVIYEIQRKYAAKIKIDYDIYKDKYWQSFDRFLGN